MALESSENIILKLLSYSGVIGLTELMNLLPCQRSGIQTAEK